MKQNFPRYFILPIYFFCLAYGFSEEYPRVADCLSSQFFNRQSECGVVVRSSHPGNQIIAVRTPTDRVIRLELNYSVEEFDSVVKGAKEIDDRYFYCIPTITAWKQLLPYLHNEDKIRLLAGLDQGFVVLRSGDLFCIIITGHSA